MMLTPAFPSEEGGEKWKEWLDLLLGVPAGAGGFFEGGLLAAAHAAGFFEQHLELQWDKSCRPRVYEME